MGAALLLSADSTGDDADRHVRLALAEAHPDLHIVEATTAQGRIDADTAKSVVKQAASVATAAAGDLDRARLLATDARFAVRADAMRAMPGRLNGTGARAAEIALEVRALIDDAQAMIDQRHEREVEERIERYGLRGSGKKDLEDRHKREVRRHRTAELRFALGTFAGVYRDALADARHADQVVDGIHRIERAALALERFPNETLLLQALLAQLPALDR